MLRPGAADLPAPRLGLAALLATLLATLLAALLAACAPVLPRAPVPATELPAAPGLPALPPRCLLAAHVHTHPSDRYSHAPTPANAARAYAPAGLRDALAALRRDGVDAVIVTDHNAIAGLWDPAALPAVAGLTVLLGEEWTTRRVHALLLGFRADGPWDAILPPPWRTYPDDQDLRDMVERTHARGGLVVAAHPDVPFRTWPNDPFGVDGVEVWGLRSVWIRNRRATRRWHDWLVRGERLFALAGTDLHQGALLVRRHRAPLNWVDAATCDRPTLLAGLRAGHVLLVRDRRAPRLVLGLEAGGALDFAEARAGDAVALAGPVDLQLRVLGGAGARLRVLGRAGVLLTRTLAGDDAAVRLRLVVRPGDFVRAELHRGARRLAVSNPIYFTAP